MRSMIGRVLSVASECVPFVKTGGLADVVGALPAALLAQGWQMRVLIPAYSNLRPLLADMREVLVEEALFGGLGRVFFGRVQGLDLLLLDAPHLFDREGGPYSGRGGDWVDNPQRFAALSWVAARLARAGIAGWKPDILHAHDWQAGFAPAYLAYQGAAASGGKTRAKTGVKSVLTIHNIAFQGWAEASLLAELRLPADQFHAEALEYYGGLSALKVGLVTADWITTVSQTYAQELMRPEFGMGLEGVIAARAARVSGILNGVDLKIWSPENEREPYSAADLTGKARARAALTARYDLQVPGPLAIVVSRLTDQKGIDLLPQVIPEFIRQGGGLIVLGTGDPALEAAMRQMAIAYPGRLAVEIGYDEALSHQLFAGADAVLVPSRFEPCGLTQMYGLRYGTLPVVAATGGLADTVISATPASLARGVASGVSFYPTDALAFGQALSRLVQLYADPEQWRQLQANAMTHPVGWESSAAEYARLYQQLLA